MARVFVYDDREFPDPDPEMTVDQVKATLADFYGEIANASVKQTKQGRGHRLRVPAAGGHQGGSRPHLWLGGHPMDTRTLARLLAATTPVNLAINELTAELTRPDGSLDLEAAAARQKDVETACAQAQDYASSTERLKEALRWQLRPRRS